MTFIVRAKATPEEADKYVAEYLPRLLEWFKENPDREDCIVGDDTFQTTVRRDHVEEDLRAWL